MTGPRLLRAFAAENPEARFVEIGANDGVSMDPLRPYVAKGGWTGVLVEPLPHLFERLRARYSGDERLTLVNVAIAEREERRPMYHFAEADPPLHDRLPDWYTTIGSFDRELIERHARGIPELEGRIVATEVECVTLASLFREHDVDRLDVLCVDVDGFDDVVVGQLDLDELRPRLIVYEDVHLDPDDSRACRARLEAAGYQTMQEGLEMWAVDTGPADRLSQTWRRLLERGPAFTGDDLREWMR